VYGAGEMGGQIVDGLLARDEKVLVHDPYATRGWPGCELSLEMVARRSDVHLVCVRGVDVARHVVASESGIVQNTSDGSLVILMTTMLPDEARALANWASPVGVAGVVDGAMSRRSGRISEKSLTILLGCEQSMVQRAATICARFADNVVNVGGVGAGMSAKLLNNWVLQANRWSLIRAADVARTMGIDLEKFVSVICQSTGASWVSERWGAAEDAMLAGESVDSSLLERTVSELKMMAEVLDESQVPVSLGDCLAIIDRMRGTHA